VPESVKVSDIAHVIEAAAQCTFGRSIHSVTNLVTSDGAALAVAEQEEVFPGGVDSDLCLMHSAMKPGQAAEGELVRSRNKVIQNEFPDGKHLYNVVHKLAAYFSYSDRLDKLHTYCDKTGCVKINLQLDINKTRVATIHGLFLSVILMKSAMQTYTADLQHPPAELSLSHTNFSDLVVFEGVLDVTRLTCVLAQFEQHANRAYRTLIKFLALQHLRQDFIWVIDVSTLGTNRGPRPTRVKMFKSEMSKTARECCRWFLVSVLDLRTVLCPHLDSSTDKPKLRQLVLDEYVKYGLKDYDLQAQRNATLSTEFVESQKKRQRTAQGDTRAVMHPEPQRPLSIGLSAGDAPTGKGWGSESEEEGVAVVVEQTPESRELRGKELQKEAASALRKWRKHGKELDWAPFVQCPRVVCHSVVDKPPARIVLGEADDADVTITEEPAPVVQKKVYDLMDDLLEADVLKLYRQVLAEEEALVKAGGQAQFGYLPIL
jgi:hypothetical protein